MLIVQGVVSLPVHQFQRLGRWCFRFGFYLLKMPRLINLIKIIIIRGSKWKFAIAIIMFSLIIRLVIIIKLIRIISKYTIIIIIKWIKFSKRC